MLTHVVCWKYKDSADDARRGEHRDALMALKGKIDVIRSLKVGADVLRLDRSFDTALIATFDDEAGLAAYDVHPAHQDIVALGREVAEKVVSVDFIDED